MSPDVGAEAAGSRWSWVFWLLLATAGTPLGLSVAALHRILSTADALEGTGDLQSEPSVFADHWGVLLSYDPLSWPVTISAFALLALAAVAVSGRPEWLAVAPQRLVVGSLAAVCALWAVGTTLISAWVELQAPTARQRAGELQGYRRVVLLQWLPAGGLTLLAAVVALVALWLCLATRGRRSGPSPAEDH